MTEAAGMEEDTVTCICPTSSARRHLWPQLIACFRWQSYAHKHLVMVSDGEPPSEVAGDSAVTFVQLAEDIELGRKRNLACQQAVGRWIAHFDDDDLYAPDYLEAMVGELEASRAPCGKLADWMVLDVQRRGWAEVLGTKPFEGRFAVQSAVRLFSHGFSLVYERCLAAKFPFREKELVLPAAGASPAKVEGEQAGGSGGEAEGPGSETEEGEASDLGQESGEGEGSDDDEVRVARALGRRSQEDMALLRRRQKEQQRREAGRQQVPTCVPFIEEPEDREFLLRLLEAGAPVHLVRGRQPLCVHLQHGANLLGTVAHRWVQDPAARLAGSRLADVLPAAWLKLTSPQPLAPSMEDPQRFALVAWGFMGRPGHATMLADEIAEEVAHAAACHSRLGTDLAARGRDLSVRVLELQQHVAECQKELGNGAFRASMLEDAVAHYRLALAATDVVVAFAHEVASPLREKADMVRYAVLCNLAQAAMRRGLPAEAEEQASAAMPLDRGGFKAWWRRAQAREALGRPVEAAQDLLAAWRRAPEASREREEIGRALARAKRLAQSAAPAGAVSPPAGPAGA